jgi:hypothetical protein
MNETWLGQILLDGKWVDYARGTEGQSRLWQAGSPATRRVVDWIHKDQVLVPPAQLVLTVAELRKLAEGMPYRSEARKAELVAWLNTHRPDALADR